MKDENLPVGNDTIPGETLIDKMSPGSGVAGIDSDDVVATPTSSKAPQSSMYISLTHIKIPAVHKR